MAEGPEGPLFVPFALPGERVRIDMAADSDHARLLGVLDPSPERIDPICRHFSVCGGCALQHMESGAYLAWKREQMVAALQSRGLEAEVEPVRVVGLGTRRRATFTLGGGKLGYRRARSHELIEIESCPVLSPRIVAALPGLKRALAPLVKGGREARVAITETDAGLDMLVEGIATTPSALASLAAGAAQLGLARLTLGGESLGFGAAPSVMIGKAAVKLPPGAFLQASREAEAALTPLVVDGVAGAKRIADLFSGIGTFSFALAETAKVDAFEADEPALAALAEAARHTPGLKPIRDFPRDLFRAPLTPKELKGYDAVVFDPPRAGARAQAEQLARSDVPKLVAVSCNPGTLARDLRILVDGGYRILRVVPVDQFLFSPHIEAVAHLAR